MFRPNSTATTSTADTERVQAAVARQIQLLTYDAVSHRSSFDKAGFLPTND